MLTAVKNYKIFHGLRVSEVENINLRDIDSDRMQLFIERAKGKKDRYDSLGPVYWMF
jgi:integrase